MNRLAAWRFSREMPDMEHDPKNSQPDDDATAAGQQISESKMRQALGIEARGSERPTAAPSHGVTAQRRRFVADGDVPVVLIGRRRDHGGQGPGERSDHGAGMADRVAAVEASLATERDARLRAEAALAEARHSIQNLQTQVAHSELARDEAAAHARRAEADRTAVVKELEAVRRAVPAEPARTASAPRELPTRQTYDGWRDEPHEDVRPEPSPPPARSARPAARGPDAAGCDVPTYTARIIAAYLQRNQLSPAELPTLAQNVVHALMTVSPDHHPPAADPVGRGRPLRHRGRGLPD